MANLKVTGKETLCEHEYENIEVYGAIDAQNSFKCTRLEVYGSAKLQGDCICDGKLGVHGSMESCRDVNSEEITIAGILKAAGSLNARNIEIMGKGTVGKCVKAACIDVGGSLTVDEDIEVKNIDVSGSVVCRQLTTHSVDISGKISVDGTTECSDIDVSGKMKCKAFKAHSVDASGKISVDNDIECIDLGLSGKLECKKLKATAIDVSGRINVDGDVECETAEISGSAEISDLLNAESISIESASESRIASIGCSEITVKEKSRLLAFLNSSHAPILTADLIEGDNIILEKTHAKMVRGKNVHIGKGCKIGVLEYTESYACDPSSSIGELKN